MNSFHGFSLTEVLVSLFIMTSVSLGLLKQQWQIIHLFNQVNRSTYTLLLHDNQMEHLLVDELFSHHQNDLEPSSKSISFSLDAQNQYE